MGSIGCPETSVGNYHFSLRNDPEERNSLFLKELFSLVIRNSVLEPSGVSGFESAPGHRPLTEDLVGRNLKEEDGLEDVADWRIIFKYILIGIGLGGWAWTRCGFRREK